MWLLIAESPPPWLDTNVILLLVAGLIALISRVASAVNEHRKRTAAAQRTHEERTAVVFEEQPEVKTKPAPRMAAQPTPQVRLQLGKVGGVEPPTRRRRVAESAPRPILAKPKKPATVADALEAVLAMGRNPKRARDALILREVLGPPMSLRARSPLERR